MEWRLELRLNSVRCSKLPARHCIIDTCVAGPETRLDYGHGSAASHPAIRTINGVNANDGHLRVPVELNGHQQSFAEADER